MDRSSPGRVSGRLFPPVLAFLLFFWAPLLRGQSGALLFVPDEPQLLGAWKGAGPLGFLDDQEIALALPGKKGGGLTTRKFLSLESLHAFRGDPDGRGDYTPAFVVGQIDGLAPCRREKGEVPGPRSLWMSVTARKWKAFQGGKSVTLGPGEIFRWAPGGRVEVFLSRALLAKALGFQSSTLDVDAFCLDSQGNLFFSLALDEPFPGPKVLDGDLCFLPAKAMTLDSRGLVKDVKPRSVVLAAREADLDKMLAASGLASSAGKPLLKIGNLACLALDPRGGTFLPPSSPSLGPLPNLVFGGSGKGWAMALCSTLGKGSPAAFAGVDLGSKGKTTGEHLGVRSLGGGSSDSWVSALAFLPLPPAPAILLEEARRGRFSPGAGDPLFYWAGVEPAREAFLLLVPGPTGPGQALPSLVFPPTPLGGPWEVFWKGGPVFLFPLGRADKTGGGRKAFPTPPGFSGPLLLAAQAFGPAGGGKLDLSLPVLLQWW